MLAVALDAIPHRTVEVTGASVVWIDADPSVVALAQHVSAVRSVLDVSFVEGPGEAGLYWTSGPTMDQLSTDSAPAVVRTTAGADIEDFDGDILPCVGNRVKVRNTAGAGTARVGLRVLTLHSR